MSAVRLYLTGIVESTSRSATACAKYECESWRWMIIWLVNEYYLLMDQDTNYYCRTKVQRSEGNDLLAC